MLHGVWQARVSRSHQGRLSVLREVTVVRSTVVIDKDCSLGRPELMVPESYNPADHAITQISMNPETKDVDLERITVGFELFIFQRETISAHSCDLREG